MAEHSFQIAKISYNSAAKLVEAAFRDAQKHVGVSPLQYWTLQAT
jgi:hypothetical protein